MKVRLHLLSYIENSLFHFHLSLFIFFYSTSISKVLAGRPVAFTRLASVKGRQAYRTRWQSRVAEIIILPPSIVASVGANVPSGLCTSKPLIALPSLLHIPSPLSKDKTILLPRRTARSIVGPCCATWFIPYVWFSARRARRWPTGAFSVGWTFQGSPLSLDTAKSQKGMAAASLRCESRKCGHDGRLMPDSCTK